MKQFLIALLALAMIAGCDKSEEEATTDNDPAEMSAGTQGPGAGLPADDPEEDSAETSEKSVSEEESSATEAPTGVSQTTSGLSTSDIVGDWTGKIYIDPADLENARAEGASEQQIQQQIQVIESIVIDLVFKSDMTFKLTSMTPLGPQELDSTWSLGEGDSIVLVMKTPPDANNPSGSDIETSLIVSKDRKSMEMPDAPGQSKTKPVYTKKQ